MLNAYSASWRSVCLTNLGGGKPPPLNDERLAKFQSGTVIAELTAAGKEAFYAGPRKLSPKTRRSAFQMAGPNKQARKTARRKARQAEQRRIQKLRHRALNYEGMSPAVVARSSPEFLERVCKSKRRYRMVTPMDELALLLAVNRK